MSEGMGIEKAAADLAELKGYNTKVRIPCTLKSSNVNALSDLDVVGVNADGEILVIECKAHGSPETYKNYNTKGRSGSIEEENNIVQTLSKIVNETEKPLDPLFEDQEFEVDELWYVFKGYFDEESGGQSQFHESKEEFEEDLEEFLGVKVRLIPSHRLFCDLTEEVSEDMMKRRKRYGSPIKEVFRHLIAAYNEDPKFLEELEESFRKTDL